jgi:DNA-binding MarR family transcriptional regulator
MSSKGIFLQGRAPDVLIAMEHSKNVSQTSKESDCTYSHASRLAKVFKDKGWVKLEMKGRDNRITITETGKKVIRILKELIAETRGK